MQRPRRRSSDPPIQPNVGIGSGSDRYSEAREEFGSTKTPRALACRRSAERHRLRALGFGSETFLKTRLGIGRDTDCRSCSNRVHDQSWLARENGRGSKGTLKPSDPQTETWR